MAKYEPVFFIGTVVNVTADGVIVKLEGDHNRQVECSRQSCLRVWLTKVQQSETLIKFTGQQFLPIFLQDNVIIQGSAVGNGFFVDVWGRYDPSDAEIESTIRLAIKNQRRNDEKEAA